MNAVITCRKCSHQFELSEILAAPFVESARQEMLADLAAARQDADDAQEKLAKGERDLARREAPSHSVGRGGAL